MKIKIFDETHYQLFPETEDMVDLDITEQDLGRIGIDKCFDLKTNSIVDYFNVELYESAVVEEIRKKYNVNQELAILRQRDSKPEEFAEYNEYVENCKEIVKEKFKKFKGV